ncbi:hypothetical protein BN1211_4495 [Cyberlindnera jadinii]|uniref:Uncharacterized protein n=1 Tax=Cyberlindnera jadinii (strain ATCC 18201 / CBS 1600 / BCRC 20928 / JCM 3617 / NBRC 0987 / NRRL Y-1542) TaxID=983966 RepID=A0A0H5C6L4_CYBJN|nr:hypothetical protein BN1211_4495 [Cyberlindnera jadinii]
MPRLRRSVQKIDGLQTGPIDSEEQDELVDLLKLENYQTNWQFINILTVLYLFPIPLFIHLRYYRRLPVDSFLSIVVQIFSVVGVRYLSFFPTEGGFVLKQLTKHLVFDTFMNIIAVVVLWRQLDLSHKLYIGTVLDFAVEW